MFSLTMLSCAYTRLIDNTKIFLLALIVSDRGVYFCRWQKGYMEEVELHLFTNHLSHVTWSHCSDSFTKHVRNIFF